MEDRLCCVKSIQWSRGHAFIRGWIRKEVGLGRTWRSCCSDACCPRAAACAAACPSAAAAASRASSAADARSRCPASSSAV